MLGLHLEDRSLSSWRAWIEIKTYLIPTHRARSLSSWRAWIEIAAHYISFTGKPRRSPHGERGLKFAQTDEVFRGVSRSPHGERGLKWRKSVEEHLAKSGRSPHGERGLKSWRVRYEYALPSSLSSWRAWIEIKSFGAGVPVSMSLSSWRAWIEIRPASPMTRRSSQSLSSWRAWIEIEIHC